MKKMVRILLLAFLVCGLSLSSCKKGSSSPVDEYVEVIDNTTKEAKKINSLNDFMNFQQFTEPEEAKVIVRQNADYVLTEKDKKKLKESYGNLLKVAYEKTLEFGGVPEELKKQAKEQVDLIIDGANKTIDNANTLGDLSGI